MTKKFKEASAFSFIIPTDNYIDVVDIVKESSIKVIEQKSHPMPCTDNSNMCQEVNNNNNKYTNFEDILEALGGFGRYQMLILVLLLVLEIPTAFVTFIPIFIGRVPPIWNCGNATLGLVEICACENPIPLQEDLEESIIAQWGLICDKEWVFDFITSIQMLGMLFGSVFGSQFADWYGRRYGFLTSTLVLLFGSIISAISGNPYIYAVARFLCGAGVTSFMNITLVGVMEVMPTKWRSFSNCIGPTGEGIMILSILAYFIRPWRSLYFATLAPFALIVVIFPFVSESPRWLLKQNRIDETANVLQRIAKINGRNDIQISTTTLHLIVKKENGDIDNKKWTYLDFIKDPNLRVISAYNMAIWFAWSLTYYGISFNIKNVEGNIYVNVFCMGCANAIGQRFALLLNNRLGRRKSLFCSMTCCAVFLVSLAIILVVMDISNVPQIVIVSFCLLGQFGMSSARSAARLISGESYSTAVRTMGHGISGFSSNIAGILVPQLAYLGNRYWPSLPFFIFAFISVGGSLIAFRMSETMGCPLDGENEKETKKLPPQSSLHNVFSKNTLIQEHSNNLKVDSIKNDIVLVSIISNLDDFSNPCFVPDP